MIAQKQKDQYLHISFVSRDSDYRGFSKMYYICIEHTLTSDGQPHHTTMANAGSVLEENEIKMTKKAIVIVG